MTPETLSFLSGTNADFIAELSARYARDPSSIDPSWRAFFAELRDDAHDVLEERRGASWSPSAAEKVILNKHEGQPAPIDDSSVPAGSVNRAIIDSIRAIMFIRATRVRGHLFARLDPLNMTPVALDPEIDPKAYGFTRTDLDRPIFIDGMLGMQTATMREIMAILKRTYCGAIGVEFMHMQEPHEKAWVQERIESSQSTPQFSLEAKRAILQRLTAAESFEKFLHVKFTGTKRFGIEGGETMIPALETFIAHGADRGLREVVFGMAHRGRLNVLTNLLNKPFRAMFAEFHGTSAYPDSVQGSGDVKYHLGASTDRVFGGTNVHLSLNANPSHLEFVDPVVVGRVRGKQQRDGGDDEAQRRTAGLLIHGDAAFAGQGIVAETLMLSELQGYTTGGTIHFVINNQVGFTTSPHYSRSGVYCTDVAKMIQAPIFHVNGDDVEAVLLVAQIAAEYRQKFLKDVVIDMVCYRRQGHNESDEPAFTQPLMVKKIKALPTTRDLYARKLVAEGALTQVEADKIQSEFIAHLEQDFKIATGFKADKADWLEGLWAGYAAASGENRDTKTGVDLSTLRAIGHALAKVPEGFDINPKIAKQLDAKRAMVDTGEGIDWATAEALAFGTLLLEGSPVRLSGQDCGRGTFSQRHAALYDQTNEKVFVPLNNLKPEQAAFEVHDSPLSEAAVLGFDYGYSMIDPNGLVCWEGQFGDFANGAQVIIDQFLACAESKWLRMSGLVMLLPHGYEGQGPEHSSARLERYLQLCAEDNLQVANCTTPANYFHILRRQIKRNFRKPLILMTPKSLLRHKGCVSALQEFGPDSAFQAVYSDSDSRIAENKKVSRVVLCCGKVYYDLLAARDARKITDIALVRVEQLYPLPAKRLAAELARYPKAEIVWCQEEPENMGAWHFIDRRLESVLTDIDHKTRRPVYVGREEGASPATGSFSKHSKQQTTLVEKALT